MLPLLWVLLTLIIAVLGSAASIEKSAVCTSENADRVNGKESIIKKYFEKVTSKMDLFGIFKSLPSCSNRLQQEIKKANIQIKNSKISEIDPSQLGPYDVISLNDIFVNQVTGHKFKIHAVYPTKSTTDGVLFPVIIIAHGFQLSSSQYFSYAIKLASFGYFTIVVNYPTSFFGNNNIKQAKDLIACLDWAITSPYALKSKWVNMIDTNNVGIMGHSLGGKLSFLAATLDTRIKAVFGIDPVDGMGILVRNEMHKLKIPTGFVGEIMDGTGLIKSCAPSSLNYQTLYKAACSPSYSITINGACHLSFLDNIDHSRLLRRICKHATVSSQSVRDLTSTVITAFFQRHLRNMKNYDEWLIGGEMQRKYIKTGQASIVYK